MSTAGTDPPSPEWAWVRTLGALQETQRLGHTCVETGHLLLTVYADPLVRGVLVRNGLDLRDVQVRVGDRPAVRDTVLLADQDPPAAVTAIAPDAVAVLTRLGRDLAPAAASTTGPTSPGPSFAEIHRRLTVLLLGEDAPESVDHLLADLLPADGRRRIARRLAVHRA